MRATERLDVVVRVPVRVVDDDGVGRGEVDAQAAGARRQQEGERRRGGRWKYAATLSCMCVYMYTPTCTCTYMYILPVHIRVCSSSQAGGLLTVEAVDSLLPNVARDAAVDARVLVEIGRAHV